MGYEPGQREDADADNSADADGCQLPEAKTLKKSAVFVLFLNIVDGLRLRTDLEAVIWFMGVLLPVGVER